MALNGDDNIYLAMGKHLSEFKNLKIEQYM